MWNLKSSNKLCSDRFTVQSHQKHVNNIQKVKPSIDNSAPQIPSFLRSRAKQEKMKEGILFVPLKPEKFIFCDANCI